MLLFYFFNKFFYSESIPVIRTAGTGIFQKQYMGGLKKFQPGQIGDGTCYIRYIIRKNKNMKNIEIYLEINYTKKLGLN